MTRRDGDSGKIPRGVASKNAVLYRLGRRAVFYALYSSVVWGVVAVLGLPRFANDIGSATWNATKTAFSAVAASSVFGGMSTFAFAARFRRRGEIRFEEVLTGIAGRAGVPFAALVAVVASCDEAVARPVLLTTLVGYFLTAPIAVWGIWPPP